MENKYIVLADLPNGYTDLHRTWAAFCTNAEITIMKLKGQTEDEYNYAPLYWIVHDALYKNNDQNPWSPYPGWSWEEC